MDTTPQNIEDMIGMKITRHSPKQIEEMKNVFEPKEATTDDLYKAMRERQARNRKEWAIKNNRRTGITKRSYHD